MKLPLLILLFSAALSAATDPGKIAPIQDHCSVTLGNLKYIWATEPSIHKKTEDQKKFDVRFAIKVQDFATDVVNALEDEDVAVSPFDRERISEEADVFYAKTLKRKYRLTAYIAKLLHRRETLLAITNRSPRIERELNSNTSRLAGLSSSLIGYDDILRLLENVKSVLAGKSHSALLLLQTNKPN